MSDVLKILAVLAPVVAAIWLRRHQNKRARERMLRERQEDYEEAVNAGDAAGIVFHSNRLHDDDD